MIEPYVILSYVLQVRFSFFNRLRLLPFLATNYTTTYLFNKLKRKELKMATKFEQTKMEQSVAAFDRAKRLVYRYFGDDIEILPVQNQDDVASMVVDFLLATDYIIKKGNEVYNLAFRVREFKYYKAFGAEITITEMNNATGVKSELYKLDNTDYSLYCYQAPDGCIDFPILYNSKLFSEYWKNGMVEDFDRRSNNKEQTFIIVPYKELRRLGLVLEEDSMIIQRMKDHEEYEYKEEKGI